MIVTLLFQARLNEMKGDIVKSGWVAGGIHLSFKKYFSSNIHQFVTIGAYIKCTKNQKTLCVHLTHL